MVSQHLAPHSSCSPSRTAWLVLKLGWPGPAWLECRTMSGWNCTCSLLTIWSTSPLGLAPCRPPHTCVHNFQLVQTVWVHVWSPSNRPVPVVVVFPSHWNCICRPAAATGRQDQRSPCTVRIDESFSAPANFADFISDFNFNSQLASFHFHGGDQTPFAFPLRFLIPFSPFSFPSFPSRLVLISPPAASHSRRLTLSCGGTHTQNDTVSSSTYFQLSPDYDLPSALPLRYCCTPETPYRPSSTFLALAPFSTDTTATPIEPLLRRRRRPLFPLRHHLESVCDFQQDIVKRLRLVCSESFDLFPLARPPSLFSDSLPANPCL